jgi:hypothetical protein
LSRSRFQIRDALDQIPNGGLEFLQLDNADDQQDQRREGYQQRNTTQR